MFRGLLTCMLIATLHNVFDPRGWRLASPTQAPAQDCAPPHRPQHLAVTAVPQQVCLAPKRHGLSGAVAALVLAWVFGYLVFLGLGQVHAVASPLPQHGPNAVPRPYYYPGHRTVTPPTKPLRQRCPPDWYCCCKAAYKPACQCDRSQE